jgi:hypothetical protein
LKTAKSEYSRNSVLGNSAPETSLGTLKIEVNKLKNSLILKSKELENLRLRNDTLEGKIVGMETEPYSKTTYNIDNEPLQPNYTESLTVDPPNNNQRRFQFIF